MDAARLVARLERTGAALPALLDGTAAEEARWRPPDGAWSILEIVAHLADEEVEDFRPRLELTLADPARPWPPIDPEGAATARRYNEGDLTEAVARFAGERAESVRRLRARRDPEWSRAHEHATIGPLRAGDLLASWVAHDALHLRQIAKRLFQLTEADAGGYATRYAGAWTA